MDLIIILFLLFILLAIMTVVGHVIWVVISAILRWLFDTSTSDDKPPNIAYTAPRPPPSNPRTETFKDLAATERQIIKFYTDGKINDEVYEKLLESEEHTSEPPVTATSRMPSSA